MKFLKRLFNKTILKTFEQAFIWKFRLKYGISPKKWERLVRRHGELLRQMLGWELRNLSIPYKKKRYEDYTNFLTHEQKIELMEKDNKNE